MNGLNDIEFALPNSNRPRSGVVFAVACMVLALAFVFPLSEKILDVLWICCFCLSGAVTLICLTVRSSADLGGFVPMMSSLLFLRLITQAAAARHIIRDEPAGVLLGGMGSVLSIAGPFAAMLIGLLAVAVCVFAVFAACRRIALTAKHYLQKILPLKRMGIETDLRLGVLDNDQADALTGRVESESRFFFRMSRISLLLRGQAIISVLILLACMIFPAARDTVNLPSGSSLLSAIAPQVTALSIFIMIPSFMVAVSCGKLMGRDTLTLRKDEQGDSTTRSAKTITVVALDSEGAEETELLNPDFVHHRVDEQIVQFEPEDESTAGVDTSVITDIFCRNAKEYYEKLSRVICAVNSRPRLVLLASDKVHSLPVTVAVNTAIRLAQKKQRVLLVDTDTQRNAIGSVFDLDSESMRKKVQSSCLENLSVCCVPAEKLGHFLRNEKVLGHFSTTLIYTPNLQAVHADGNGKAIKPGAFYFVDDEDSASKKTAEQKLAFCSWLCLIPSIQSVLDGRQRGGS